MLVINELREYIFGLFLGKECSENVVDDSNLQFLGTAFFVSKRGDAVTANHVIPARPLEGKERIFGIMMKGRDVVVYKLIVSARFEASDFALLRFDISDVPFFELDFNEHLIGTDVLAFGYADHDLHGKGKELRLLKGYMTMPVSHGFGELSFPIPSGMSGGPVLCGTKCIGFMMGNLSSEKLLERTEEISEVYNSVEKITFFESKQVLHYGIFRPFSIYKGLKSELFGNKDLFELIAERNQP